MVTEIRADEVVEFQTAVAGVEIDWIRTDQGFGGAVMVSSGEERVAVSNGGVDFSTMLHCQVPADRVALQLVTRAPDGMSWCGSEADDMELRVFRPTMSVFGNVPAGSRAVTLVAWLDPLQTVTTDLRVDQPTFSADGDALPPTSAVRQLCLDMLHVANEPGLVESSSGATRLLESTAIALASVGGQPHRDTDRGFSSRDIVAACLGYVDATGRHRPTVSELCRVALASETRLRQAFVEIFGVPPMQYFALRVLSRLRNDLLRADPSDVTVTHVATSLGLTQLGRVAGRYRAMFGESPSQTLQTGKNGRLGPAIGGSRP